MIHGNSAPWRHQFMCPLIPRKRRSPRHPVIPNLSSILINSCQRRRLIEVRVSQWHGFNLISINEHCYRLITIQYYFSNINYKLQKMIIMTELSLLPAICRLIFQWLITLKILVVRLLEYFLYKSTTLMKVRQIDTVENGEYFLYFCNKSMCCFILLAMTKIESKRKMGVSIILSSWCNKSTRQSRWCAGNHSLLNILLCKTLTKEEVWKGDVTVFL